MSNKLIQFVLVVTFLAGCAHDKPRIVRMTESPGAFLPGSQVESVRTAENIKTYPVGRYVDPNNSKIMHEGHPVYRVESTAKWNLQPRKAGKVPSGPVTGVIDSAEYPRFQRDELYLEVARQKRTTQQVIQGSTVLSNHLGQLTREIESAQKFNEELNLLKQDVDTTRRRFDALENHLRKKQEAAVAGSSGNEPPEINK